MPRNDRGVSTLTIIIVVSIVLAALAYVLVTHQHEVATRPATAAAMRPPATADQKAQLSKITFGDFQMSAAANYLGHTETYLDGSVINTGTNPVKKLEVELNFVDTINQVVLRETAYPLADHPAPLQPGESHAFRVTFEHMPMDWNQAPPSAKAVFGEF
jgi:hypothetical protein